MAVEQKRVSEMPLVPDGQLGSFDVFGWNKTTNQSGRAPMSKLKGDSGKSAYELWMQQPGNAGKPYSEYEAYNREPATAAKNEWNVLKPEITNKITEAGEAAEAANTAASNADAKAGLADTSATNANTAASEANTAKEGVLDAIDNANDTAEHPTYIGTDFYVYKWNKTTKVYENTDIFVKGSPGAGNVDIINSPTVKKDVPYVMVPTADAAQTYNAVEAAVGGRNLLRTYNSPDLFASSGGSVLTKSVVELTEFGITDANRIVSSGGTTNFKANMSFGRPLPSGVKRIASIYLKNNSDKILTVHPNLTLAQSIVYVNPGEYTLLTLKYTGNDVGIPQIQFRAPSVSDNIDVTWARIMYEEGHIPSTPVPALEDYYENGNLKAKQMVTSNGVISHAGLINSDVLAWRTNLSPSTGALVVVFPNNVVDTGTVLQFDLNLVTTAVATTFQRSLTLHGWITHAVGSDFYGNLTGDLIVPIKSGVIDGKTCIIIGNSDTAFQAPKVYLSVRTSRTGTDLWKTGYSVQQLTDLSNVTILKDLSVVSRTVTQSELDAKASTTQLNSAISDFNTRFAGQYEIVSVRPAVGVEGKMYLVTTGTSNVYNLFTWKSVSGVFDWVDLGSTTVDLSQYAKSADVTSALSNKVDKVSGKGLSTNDFTDEDKDKLDNSASKSIIKTSTLLVANWVDDTSTSGYYKYTVTDADILSTSIVQHIPASIADKVKGQDAGMDDYADMSAGQLVIYSESAPTDDININYIIQQ